MAIKRKSRKREHDVPVIAATDKRGMRSATPPPEHTRWKPGQSGNPKGKPADSEELKTLKNLSKKELTDVANLIIKGNVSKLQALAKSDNASVLQVMIAAVAVRIISKGDMSALDILLNRLVGKVKEEIFHGGDLKLPQVIVTLPSNGREAKTS